MESERAKGLISDSSRQKAPTLAEIKSYLRSNYLVNGMRIAVVGPQPVDTLAEEVEKAFSDVKDLPLKEPQAPVKTSSSCFDPKPKADNSVMYIQAKLPSQKKNPLTRPLEYIEFMILRKTSGTLVDTLIRKKWVTGVTIDPEKQCAQSKFHLSTITFHLTETANKQAINALFFKYLKLINKKGVNLVYFNEVKFYAHRYFKYPADKNKGPTDILYIINDAELPGNRLSEAIALSLTSECPFHLAWKCTRDLESFDPKAISDLLESFINAINQNSLPTDSDQSPKAYSNIQLSLPTKNKYFPASYDDTITIRGTEIKQIYNKPNGLVWHTYGGISSDDTVVKFSISPPMESITQKTEARLGILAHYYTTLLKPVNDLLQVTESSISVEIGVRGLEFEFYGTTTNTFILDEIITNLKDANINLHSFQAAKNSALKAQKSHNDEPLVQPYEAGLAPLLKYEYPSFYYIAATKTTQFKKIQELQRNLFSTSYVEILFVGDIKQDYQTQLRLKLIPKNVRTAPLRAKFPRPTKLCPGASYVYPVLSHNPSVNSFTTLVYLETYHLEDQESRFKSLIVMHLMQSLLLPLLEKIGVALINPQRLIHLGGIVIVIEDQKDPIATELKIESELSSFRKLVKDLSTEKLSQEIAVIKATFIGELYQKVDHYWDSIKFWSYDFGWGKQLQIIN
ncbi:metalloprotease [Entomophthora muscae]|uniref:Metalloprotease n=1 Tax=Entomophthora muscae TaxID=34485 RepID=A0ACC2SFH4_9FUNG|nr:metalloprotease [Entomophthora muscae]